MALNDRRTLYISSDMETNRTLNNKYEKEVEIVKFGDEYKYVSLLSASIPNSFYTIQKDVNDITTLEIVGYTYSYKIGNQQQDVTYSYTLTIPEGYYGQDEILKYLNTLFKRIYFSDVFAGSRHYEYMENSARSHLIFSEDSEFKLDSSTNKMILDKK